uniref:NB-ARC domain containing protein n=3 Tax=Oryza TaxID=4527 RepID=Q8LM67_ORYSJ|nr:Putative NBS-LRR type resistance protein [Oryza sativa Japonica Group]AAP51994.1 NB-ARC domain containing protein [Oryza sativa Japonica Group]
MAEVVIGPLVSMVKEKVSSYLLDQYKVMEGMEQQREILERKLPAILDVIEDAEEKGAFRPGVSAWLRALKKVAYEANDVFDEFKYEALRRDARKKGQFNMLGMDVVSLFPSYNPIMFRNKMGKKLQKIVGSIEVLVSEMNSFGFIHRQQAPPSNQWRQTDSIMADSEKDIIRRSRDEEKKKIVKILHNHASSNRDLLVLPIVGMAGLGKTTFVQLIYNEPEIKNHFELWRWCCVSDDFDVGNIANSICNSTEKDHEKALQDLQEAISGKRYLIVLDDVWNREADKWEKLKTCLKLGGKGSAILTTTRDSQVARIMITGVVEAYNLEKLGEEYTKEIIQTRAFSLAGSDELSEIVQKFVDRCQGSPLAAKAFGSMLSTKTSILEWKNIIAKSDICNEKTGILPILKLSYADLPSHMKQCFAFCAIFPKNYEINVENLIQLWMAHDFIPLEEKYHFETTSGEEIFKELAWRSFFQDVKQTPLVCSNNGDRVQLRYTTTCKIHDLMHDIALYVMGKECVTITDRSYRKELLSNRSTYHLLVSRHRTGDHFDDFLRKQSTTLRTLLYPTWNTYGSIHHLSKCISLRGLQLYEIKELPIRPIKLKHLRYLNLSENCDIKELPEDISILYHLQTLNVSHCIRLRRLPKDMKYMTSLRHLYTNGCKNLEYMPPDLGHLTSLQTLTYFVVGAISGCSTVRELQNLNLCGELELCGLENVSEAQASTVNIENKVKLTHLSLEWSNDHLVDEPDRQKKVLDALKPHDGLLMLRIAFYKGNGFPTWMTDLSVLQNLAELYLVGCSMCEEFPQFCHLNVLKVLCLTSLDNLASLCSYTTSNFFPALRELQLHRLERLERWSATEGEEVTFPLLESASIMNCPMLKSLPKAPKLRILKLVEEKAELSLLILRSRFSSLSKLTLSVSDGNAGLELDQNYEAPLSEMELCGCAFFFPLGPSRPTVGIWKWFGQLVDLKIESCDVLVYWPEEEFICLVSLKNLAIEKCNNLIGHRHVSGESTRVPSDQLLPYLTSLSIRQCKSLEEIFRLPPSLTSISIHDCRNLQLMWREDKTESESVIQVERRSEHCNDLASTIVPDQQSPSLRNNSLPCLESLTIGRCHRLVTLNHLPPTVKSLGIGQCDNLHSVQLDALNHSLKKLLIFGCEKLCSVSGQLDALKRLIIDHCNKLESLDCLGDLPSLRILRLEGCRRLQSVAGCHGRYPLLQDITIKYCPAINVKPLYERLGQRIDSLEIRELSDVHSRNPEEGERRQKDCRNILDEIKVIYRQENNKNTKTKKSIKEVGKPRVFDQYLEELGWPPYQPLWDFFGRYAYSVPTE